MNKLPDEVRKNIMLGKYNGQIKVGGIRIKRDGDTLTVLLLDQDYEPAFECGAAEIKSGESLTFTGLESVFIQLRW